MTDVNRRTILRMMTAAPVAALVWTETEAEAAAQAAGTARQTAQRTATVYKPKFFTPHQWATVSMLVDLIIPKDDRSGSATDAGVPEFMDFMMIDTPGRQSAMRGGLAWLDRECNKRFDKTFVAATDAQRREILDEISWPRRARPELAAGVAFFNSFRDLTASGFFSSKIGVQDLQYMGNTFVPKFTGCPEPVLKKLGLMPGPTE
ncbi:MAG TPA: gluconate 2-dehydrogenase subunit 3 family protein [Vicinamibacterales bacterium]|nr:gluconate 2-dehydrogenase subunit 3 family protein [Vicinamibacterales bacterium]